MWNTAVQKQLHIHCEKVGNKGHIFEFCCKKRFGVWASVGHVAVKIVVS